MRLLIAALGCALLASTSENVRAQSYPDRPVKIIVPSGAGGGFDFVARTLAPALSEALGQNFVVENRTGAGTLIGTQAAAQADPDGYTLVIGGLPNMVANVALYDKLPYDPAVDFVPVALVYTQPFVAVVRKDFPAATLQDFITAVRAAPGKVTVANAGIGTVHHLMSANFMQLTNAKVLEVAYRGSQPAYPDLLSGRTDAIFDTLPSARGQIQNGSVRALAMISPRRAASLPDIPTAREAGLPGWEVESWLGVFAPAKTPPEVIARLRAGIAKALENADTRRRFEATGEVMNLSPAATDAFIKSEFVKWTKIIRDAGIKANP